MTEARCSAPRQSSHDRRDLLIVSAVLFIATILLRLPPLLNARDVNSDAATVGLQAMHMLRGEWSWFLWGAGYQSSVGSAITAAAFMILGASPLVLILVPLVGHCMTIYLALVVLKKRIGLGPAAISALILAVTPCAIIGIAILPPRQWCITLIFLSIWLLDGAAESAHWSAPRFALAMLAAALAVFVDLYALVFVPGIVLLALLCVMDGTGDRKVWLQRAASCGGGAALGIAAVVLIRLVTHAATNGTLSAGFYHFRYRLALLWNQVLPCSLGYKLLRDSENPFARMLWTAPMPWLLFQIAAGWSLLVGIALGGLSFLNRGLSWGARRLGVFGAAVAATTFASFAMSTMPGDMWAARYLGPVFWMAPFALAPVGAHLGTRRFAVAIAPYLVVAAVATWFSYGFRVNGPFPRQYAGPRFDREEQQLCDFLRSRGIRYAASDYWFAYRFSFVFHEDPVIAPIDLSLNRYAPYVERFRAERVKAWVFHPTWSRTRMDVCLAVLRDHLTPFSSYRVGDFTVIVFPDPAVPVPTRAPSPAASPATKGSRARRTPALLQ